MSVFLSLLPGLSGTQGRPRKLPRRGPGNLVYLVHISQAGQGRAGQGSAGKQYRLLTPVPPRQMAAAANIPLPPPLRGAIRYLSAAYKKPRDTYAAGMQARPGNVYTRGVSKKKGNLTSAQEVAMAPRRIRIARSHERLKVPVVTARRGEHIHNRPSVMRERRPRRGEGGRGALVRPQRRATSLHLLSFFLSFFLKPPGCLCGSCHGRRYTDTE